MLRPHQSADSDHRSACPFRTQAPSRSRVSNPSEPGKLVHWRTINGCSCGAWSLGDSDRTRPSVLYYSICSLCSAGQLAKCRAWVNDLRQFASANFRELAVHVSPWISRILADLRPQADASAHLCRRPPWPSARRPWRIARRDDQFGISKDTASDRCDTELKLSRPSIWGISGGKWPSLR